MTLKEQEHTSPFEKKTPSGLSSSTCSAEVVAGTTVTSQPGDLTRLSMLEHSIVALLSIEALWSIVCG
jgi:hypothetical protein